MEAILEFNAIGSGRSSKFVKISSLEKFKLYQIGKIEKCESNYGAQLGVTLLMDDGEFLLSYLPKRYVESLSEDAINLINNYPVTLYLAYLGTELTSKNRPVNNIGIFHDQAELDAFRADKEKNKDKTN